MKEVGERLRTLREGIKLSQAKIAAMIGASQVSVNRYETGAGAPPLRHILPLLGGLFALARFPSFQ